VVVATIQDKSNVKEAKMSLGNVGKVNQKDTKIQVTFIRKLRGWERKNMHKDVGMKI
jgi:hypothetical protein